MFSKCSIVYLQSYLTNVLYFSYADSTTDYFEHTNFDMSSVVTPIRVDVLKELLLQSNYNWGKTKYLIEGFTEGFSLGYQGPRCRNDESSNIPLHIGFS